MPHYEATITTPRNSLDAFDYLADFASVAEWDPSVESARRLGTEPIAVGTRFEIVVSFLGRRTTLIYAIVELERPRRVVLRAETGSLVSTDTISFAPAGGDGTTVTYAADLALKGWRRPFELPMQLAFRRLGDRARDGLERSLR